jgi:hypothetical protein
MQIITWNVDDVQETIQSLDELASVNFLLSQLEKEDFDTDEITTNDAISLCKFKLMGEYHCVLARQYEQYLNDSEVYLLTWDGEASDGGEMTKLDTHMVRKIASEQAFKEK